MAKLEILYINQNRTILTTQSVSDINGDFQIDFDDENFVFSLFLDGKRVTSPSLTPLEQYACTTSGLNFETENLDFSKPPRNIQINISNLFFLVESKGNLILNKTFQLYIPSNPNVQNFTQTIFEGISQYLNREYTILLNFYLRAEGQIRADEKINASLVIHNVYGDKIDLIGENPQRHNFVLDDFSLITNTFHHINSKVNIESVENNPNFLMSRTLSFADTFVSNLAFPTLYNIEDLIVNLEHYKSDGIGGKLNASGNIYLYTTIKIFKSNIDTFLPA